MIDMLTGAFEGIKAATDITKGLLSVKTEAAVASKAVELTAILAGTQGQLLEAQAKQSAIIRRVDELEREIVDLKNWSHEKERYQLHELAPGTLTYRVKPLMQGTEPVHDLCPNCYQQGVKSILQNNAVVRGFHSLICPSCKVVLLGARVDLTVDIARRDHDPFSRRF